MLRSLAASHRRPAVLTAGLSLASARPLHYWLRHETKPDEQRAYASPPVQAFAFLPLLLGVRALLPKHVSELISAGHTVTVEASPARCAADDEYAAVGARMAPTRAWEHDAPDDAVIIGLKELPPGASYPLKHRHIFFGHVYKRQHGWQETLQRFDKGKGKLYDMEFLTHDNGVRVAAFGRAAGFTGCAVGALAWAQQGKDAAVPLNALRPFKDYRSLVLHCREQMRQGHGDALPRVLVLGYKGRVGGGAASCARDIGIPDSHLTLWDMEETARGGPFPELLEHDIVVNSVYINKAIPPFLTPELVQNPPNGQRQLSVLVDVSCDPTGPHNPLPLYTEPTTVQQPVLRLDTPDSPLGVLDLVAIDHLPSLVPRDSSLEFADQLMPHLLDFPNSPVWDRALDLFDSKVGEALNES